MHSILLSPLAFIGRHATRFLALAVVIGFAIPPLSTLVRPWLAAFIVLPLVIALIAVPILIPSYGIFFIAYGAAWALKVPHRIAAPCALIGTSNFFELAVAVAISLFGLNSGAALATVVGVLVEVPVMLSLVALANRTRGAFPEGEGERPVLEDEAAERAR